MSSLESDEKFLGSAVEVHSDVKSDAASLAASAHVLLMTGPEQDASLPPPLDESTSEEF